MSHAQNVGLDRMRILRSRFYRSALLECVSQLWHYSAGYEIDAYWTLAGHLLIDSSIIDQVDVDYAARIVASAFGIEARFRLLHFTRALDKILAAEGLDFRIDLPEQFADMSERFSTLLAASDRLSDRK